MINRIKDFIYDKSDITVVLVIFCLAGFVIFTRIEAILDYPAAFAKEQQGLVTKQDKAPEKNSTEPAIVGSSDGAITEDPHTSDGAVLAKPEVVSMYISYGEPLQSIAQKFVDAGFFQGTDDFFAAVNAANAGTKIKAGNFIIPAGATPAEIIAIISR